MRIIVFCLCSFIVFVSCSKSNLTYLSDLGDKAVFEAKLADGNELKILPGTLLRVTLSSQSPESNALFNSGLVLTGSDIGSTAPGSSTIGSSMTDGYLVDKNGYVNLPFLGRMNLNGLTLEQATDNVTSVLKKYVKDPVINIRVINFKVTVIGEVNRPSTLYVSGEKINILEALGNAGDMTPFGKRDNVVIIRDMNGVRSTVRVNLNEKSLLNSPYFYLQQNDIIYVEPNKARGFESRAGATSLTIWLSLASLAAFIISTFR
jgi:polysaccharide export outer membrane protein